MRRLVLALLFACNGTDPITDAGIDAGTDAGIEVSWEEAFDAEDLGWLLYVWGSAENDVYAVGGSPSEGVIMHYDGSAWSRVETGLSFPLINWCYGFGSDDITFVGAEGTVLHFDGTDFTLQETGTEETLWGVWGSAPNDLWSVGGRGTQPGQATVLHFDGTAWAATATPALSRENVSSFFKVWGTARDNVYVVGQRGAIIRFDGSSWSEVVTGATDDLISIWGTGPDRIIAIGGRDNGQAVAYDGTSWRFRSLVPIAGLNGVWTRSRDTFHVAGAQGTVATLDFDTLDYELGETDTFLTLHGVFGVGGQLYAVGGSLLDIRPPYQGIALVRGLSD